MLRSKTLKIGLVSRMDILVIVNESPWGSSLAGTAQRFIRAALDAGHRVPAVFFQNDGVYNALGGRAADDGLPSPFTGWCELGRRSGVQLLLCSAASARRLEQSQVDQLPAGFREAGLARMWELAVDCDRLVTF
jgi:tRNA 2-thiouridine synthesizing protein D